MIFLQPLFLAFLSFTFGFATAIPSVPVANNAGAANTIVGHAWNNTKSLGDPSLNIYAISKCVHINCTTIVAAVKLTDRTHCIFFADGTCDKTRGAYAILDGPGEQAMPWRMLKNGTKSYICGEETVLVRLTDGKGK